MSSGLARGVADGAAIYPGDQVLLQAEVIQSVAGKGALLRIFSKTDEQEVWVSEDHLQSAVVDDLTPEEPAHGSWRATQAPEGHNCVMRVRVWHRDDERAPYREQRRHQEHWWDVVENEWVDWPTAVSRGATGIQGWPPVDLVAAQADQVENRADLDEAMLDVWLHGRWREVSGKMGAKAREAAAAAIGRARLEVDVAAPGSSVRWWEDDA